MPRDIALYDAGFPCQPFSLLHNKSRLFQEAEAEVFKEVMKTIYTIKPLIGILENVLGLLRVWGTVESYLRKQHDYLYGKLIIDPVKLGACVRRRRVYIVLIHRFLQNVLNSLLWADVSRFGVGCFLNNY